MKLYIDEITLGELLGILIRLPIIFIGVFKEEWFWFTKLAKYEISSPVDWEGFREKALAESRHRMKHHQNAQNRFLRGSG